MDDALEQLHAARAEAVRTGVDASAIGAAEAAIKTGDAAGSQALVNL